MISVAYLPTNLFTVITIIVAKCVLKPKAQGGNDCLKVKKNIFLKFRRLCVKQLFFWCNNFQPLVYNLNWLKLRNNFSVIRDVKCARCLTGG